MAHKKKPLMSKKAHKEEKHEMMHHEHPKKEMKTKKAAHKGKARGK